MTVYGFPSGYYQYSGDVTGDSGGLRVPIEGWYTLTATMRWSLGTAGRRQVRLTVNGEDNAVAMSYPGANASADNNADTIAAVTYLNADDLVQMMVYQSSGSALSSAPWSELPMLGVARIGG